MTSIVHIVQRMAPGGIETLVLDLARADATMRVLSLEGTTTVLVENWSQLSVLGDRLIALEKPAGFIPRLIPQIARQLRIWRTDAIIAHHIGPLLYGGLAARVLGIKTRIHVEHDAWHYEEPSHVRLGKILKFLIRPRKVAVSQGTAERAALALGDDPIEIIPNGVDLERFTPQDRQKARSALHLPLGVQLIGSVGRLVKVKGHDILLEACQHLSANIHIAIVGDGEERANLERQALRLGLEDQVHFLGQRHRPETIYPAFDLFCLPSRAEGFPRTLIEAQACNIPVVATDVGGSREAVCPKTGRLVEAENPLALATALIETLQNPPGSAPRLFVDPDFSLAKTVASYAQVAREKPKEYKARNGPSQERRLQKLSTLHPDPNKAPSQ